MYLMIRGKNADDACIGRGEPSRASLRSVPPRVSNFFLSVSRSAMAANARADLSRCAFIRVEQAMRNWPRPMKIRIRYGSTNSRPMHLPPSVSPFPLFFCFGQDEMDLNERPGCLRNCDICQDDVSHHIDRSLSLSLAFFCVSPRPEEKVAKPRRILSGRKTATSRYIASNDRLVLPRGPEWTRVGKRRGRSGDVTVIPLAAESFDPWR